MNQLSRFAFVRNTVSRQINPHYLKTIAPARRHLHEQLYGQLYGQIHRPMLQLIKPITYRSNIMKFSTLSDKQFYGCAWVYFVGVGSFGLAGMVVGALDNNSNSSIFGQVMHSTMGLCMGLFVGMGLPILILPLTVTIAVNCYDKMTKQ